MLTKEDLKNLAAVGGPCLSVFEPLRDVTGQVSVAGTRLTTAAQQADALLMERHFAPETRTELLRPILKLAQNTDWAGRSGSFVIFRSPDFTNASFWPGVLEPSVRLGEQFFVLPLLDGLEPRDFWILALSTGRIRLYRGNSQKIAEVTLPADLPTSLAAAGAFDQPDHDLEARSSPGLSNGQSSQIRFGTSADDETKWRHIRDYCRMIDRAIRPVLAPTGDPLILAAVERAQTIYREVNTYAHLLGEGIHGSPESLGVERLHENAVERMTAESACTVEKMRQEMDTAAGAKLLTTGVIPALNAARKGLVHRLLVGRINQADEELVNAAVLAVIRNSGAVAVNAPVEGVAAILRYRPVAAQSVTGTREFAGTRAEP